MTHAPQRFRGVGGVTYGNTVNIAGHERTFLRPVILVPWRPGNAIRVDLWNAVRPHIDRIGWPVYLGDAPGPWARGRAVNAAADIAGDWDVALIADADTIPDIRAVRRAATIALDRDAAIRPHDVLYALTPSQTRVAIRRGVEVLNIHTRQRTMLGGGLLVVSRAAWDAVDGYDENFVGWGHEDSDLHTRLLVRADWDRIPGVAYHLWHPRDRRTPQTAANRARMDYVQRESRDVIEAASRDRGYDVGSIL